MAQWTAERLLSADDAQRLIDEQFPTLRPSRATLLGAGWDNTAFLVNEAYVFRFPRRQVAVDFITAETAVLPQLASRLPLAVPTPLFVGVPDSTFPWPFAGYRQLPGRTACEAHLSPSLRQANARPLARFLSALHSIPHDEAVGMGAGPDRIARMDMSTRLPEVRERLERLKGAGIIKSSAPWQWIFDSVGETPASKVLVHGDLYVRHILLNGDELVTGIIDWGDVHLGHPAIDLSIAHSFLPPSAHGDFREAYGPIDDHTWRLARFRALHYAVMLSLYGHDIRDGDLVREAAVALDFLTESPGHSTV
jgi:aminoglycoside phosphotransferase (APT) family kinase protein